MDVKLDSAKSGVYKLKSFREKGVSRTISPLDMNCELREAAMCKAAEHLIFQLAQLSAHENEQVHIFPQKLIRLISSISHEMIPVISKCFARSIVLDKSKKMLEPVDCELSNAFIQQYAVHLFQYEPMANAKRAAQWFLDNNFIITLDLELMREQRLLTGIKDALNQVDEAFEQVNAVQAGFTINELSGFFPRYKKKRFYDLSLYSNQIRKKGNAARSVPKEVELYKKRIAKMRLGEVNLDSVRVKGVSKILTPFDMNSELREAAMCKASEQLILQLAQLSDQEKEKVSIFPRSLINLIDGVSHETTPVINVHFARSLILSKSNKLLAPVDCELSNTFIQHYAAHLYQYEPMEHAKKAAQWFLDNNFVISLDITQEALLLIKVEDALIKVDEAFVQVSAVKAGFTIKELSELFPTYKTGRFYNLSVYSNQVRSKGNMVKLYPDELEFYKKCIEKYVPFTKNILEAKLLAYDELLETEEYVYPISSYEKGLVNFNI
ncbi:MAG: hypothetical protein V7749_01215 [Cocleimonas sp.]